MEEGSKVVYSSEGGLGGMMVQIQMTVFEVISKIEQFRNIVSWKVPWMTDIIVVLGVMALCLAVGLPCV